MSENQSNIIRVKKGQGLFNYKSIASYPLNDKRLSYKARGILAYLLEKPDNWEMIIEDLINKSELDGETSVRSGLTELKKLGYIARRRERGDKGKFKWITEVYEFPFEVDVQQTERQDEESESSEEQTNVLEPYPENPHMENPQVDKPHVDNPYVEKPHVENQGLLNTNITNNELTKEEDTIKPLYTSETSLVEFRGKCTHPDGKCEGCGIDDCPILDIWQQYKEIMSIWYNPTVFSQKRKKAIASRLKTFSKDQIVAAIENLSKSEWHIGHNPNGKFYADPEFIFRNDEQIEKWSQANGQKPCTQHGASSKAQKQFEAMAELRREGF